MNYKKLLSVGFLILTVHGMAETLLFNFEEKSECLWYCREKNGKTEQSSLYPFSGNYGLKYTHPSWTGNLSIWPSFEKRSPVSDWRAYDRISVDVFNNSSEKIKFGFLVYGDHLLQGARFSRNLLPFQFIRLTMELEPAFKKAGAARNFVKKIHFYSENPAKPMELYLDNITLYKKGEVIPPLSDAVVNKMTQVRKQAHIKAMEKTEAIFRRIKINDLSENAANYLNARLNQYRNDFSVNRQGVAYIREIHDNLHSGNLLKCSEAIRHFELNRSFFALDKRHGDVILGFASSMEKVLPRAAGFDVLPARVSLSVARNEHESFQLIVLPTAGDLESVALETTDFISTSGRLSKNTIRVMPVGYVETKINPPNGTPHIGFWPDPLLSFLKGIRIKSGDAQAFWIRFSVPENQKPGNYQGDIKVVINGKPAFRVPVSLQIYSFALPGKPLLPLIVSFHYDRKKPAVWKHQKQAWIDMLADYYITYDFLYGNGQKNVASWSPDFDSLEYLQENGRLGLFCLGTFDPIPNFNYIQRSIERIRRHYEEAKRRGLLSHAYIYGCDETLPENFQGAEQVAAAVKREFPDIPLVTTLLDKSYGMSDKIKSFDVFCPLIPDFVSAKATEARSRGKKVWWYICCGPLPPYPNMLIESDAIEGRLLMGAMSAKYRPDGFLYYCINQWKANSAITEGPFTTWDPNSFTNYNGDGSWTYVGSDGTPLASIRLENFRDGLEDYAYVKILEEKLSKADPKSQWAANARAALKVPKELVADLKNYANDPSHLYVWRSRLAELIESAPAD